MRHCKTPNLETQLIFRQKKPKRVLAEPLFGLVLSHFSKRAGRDQNAGTIRQEARVFDGRAASPEHVPRPKNSQQSYELVDSQTRHLNLPCQQTNAHRLATMDRNTQSRPFARMPQYVVTPTYSVERESSLTEGRNSLLPGYLWHLRHSRESTSALHPQGYRLLRNPAKESPLRPQGRIRL